MFRRVLLMVGRPSFLLVPIGSVWHQGALNQAAGAPHERRRRWVGSGHCRTVTERLVQLAEPEAESPGGILRLGARPWPVRPGGQLTLR
jgi:hypothetical protein